MAIVITVYGFIRGPGYHMTAINPKRVHRHNRRVLQQLPASDSAYPFFTKNMFSILPYRNSFDLLIPQFGYNTIHFAAEYKNMFALEVAWLEKFENLLSKLCWYDACVHTSWGIYYEFNAIGHSSGKYAYQHYGENPPQPPKHWTIKCYKLNQEELTLDRAFLEGEYISPFWKKE